MTNASHEFFPFKGKQPCPEGDLLLASLATAQHSTANLKLTVSLKVFFWPDYCRRTVIKIEGIVRWFDFGIFD